VPESVEVSVTPGAVVSMMMSLFAAKDPAAPGDARVRTASFPAMSRIVPPLSAKAVVDR
jgi:hypothetical protein